jgi:hypothetical protein
MGKLEDVMMELDTLNKALLIKKRGGGTITPDEFTQVKELVRMIHKESSDVDVPEVGRLLGLYDLGLGVRFLEPNYDKLNAAFAWLESQEGETDDDF